MSWRGGGIRTWVAQRLTAVYIGLYCCFFLVYALTHWPMDFTQWQSFMVLPLVNITTVLFWLAVFWHAWIGMRDVIMDYVSHDGVRFISLSFVGFYLLFLAVWTTKVLMTLKGSA